jgi:uncharacterized protein YecT (DUF1311 family)
LTAGVRGVRRAAAALAAAATALLAGPAFGQAESQVTPADRAAIASCVSESGNAPRACIGSVAVVCARQAPGERRDAEIACTRREAAVWRERLDVIVGALARRLESGPRSRLASVERAWESFAAQKCAFIAEVQPPARAPVMQAACELREVAAHALDLERVARRQGTGPSQRPRIER